MSTTSSTATLTGHHGRLHITVLGFELPDATAEGGEWLVARVEWDSPTARVRHEDDDGSDLGHLERSSDSGRRERRLRYW
jgi:hypothetical protein